MYTMHISGKLAAIAKKNGNEIFTSFERRKFSFAHRKHVPEISNGKEKWQQQQEKIVLRASERMKYRSEWK